MAGAWFLNHGKKKSKSQEIAIENKLPIIILSLVLVCNLPYKMKSFPIKSILDVFLDNAIDEHMGITNFMRVMGSCVAVARIYPS